MHLLCNSTAGSFPYLNRYTKHIVYEPPFLMLDVIYVSVLKAIFVVMMVMIFSINFMNWYLVLQIMYLLPQLSNWLLFIHIKTLPHATIIFLWQSIKLFLNREKGLSVNKKKKNELFYHFPRVHLVSLHKIKFCLELKNQSFYGWCLHVQIYIIEDYCVYYNISYICSLIILCPINNQMINNGNR